MRVHDNGGHHYSYPKVRAAAPPCFGGELCCQDFFPTAMEEMLRSSMHDLEDELCVCLGGANGIKLMISFLEEEGLEHS